jgi:alkanesulfonate monooxygenase SsuD/methylene tetrahydromethanopterin reductase-like flavin-dependent oxidoreductase (luciferase family)
VDLNVDSENLGNGSSVSVGAVFPARAPVESFPAFARTVEAAGLDELWLVEDCFLSAALTMAATALAVSEKITVGIGLMPAVMRNSALAAMEIATLARLHPGRFTVALGHGVRAMTAQIGASPRRRTAALEDAVVAIRALLGGATVTIDGADVRRAGVEDPTAAVDVPVGDNSAGQVERLGGAVGSSLEGVGR